MEFIVSADFLQLRLGIHQRLPIPEPDIPDGRFVALQCLKGKILCRAGNGFTVI